MRIWIINRFYLPDESATSIMASYVAESCYRQGHDVHVIASGDNLIPAATEPGVTVHFVRGTGNGKSLHEKLLNYLLFMVTASIKVLRSVKQKDIVIVKTDPPLFYIPVILYCLIKKAQPVVWMQDLYPEILWLLKAKIPGPFLLNLVKLRNSLLNKSSLVVVIGTDMRSYLENSGVHKQKLRVISNVADERVLANDDGLPKFQKVNKGSTVIGYSGNLGRAHDPDAIFSIMRRLPSPQYSFEITGAGVNYDRLKTLVGDAKLENTRFFPYAPRRELRRSLLRADIHIVSMRKGLENCILPSKIYGILAVGRPIIFLGDPKSYLALELEEAGVARAIEPDTLDGLEDALHWFESEYDEEKAIQYYVEKFSVKTSMTKWRKLIDELK